MLPKISCQPIFVTNESQTICENSTELTEFLPCACREASLEIIQTGFKKCYVHNALDSTEAGTVRDAKDACKEDDYSGSSDAACSID